MDEMTGRSPRPDHHAPRPRPGGVSLRRSVQAAGPTIAARVLWTMPCGPVISVSEIPCAPARPVAVDAAAPRHMSTDQLARHDAIDRTMAAVARDHTIGLELPRILGADPLVVTAVLTACHRHHLASSPIAIASAPHRTTPRRRRSRRSSPGAPTWSEGVGGYGAWCPMGASGMVGGGPGVGCMSRPGGVPSTCTHGRSDRAHPSVATRWWSV